MQWIFLCVRSLALIPRWGQYQNCNGYPPVCLGASDFYVDHEAAEGLGLPAGGQCTDNPDTGEWWSLPAGGKCAADSPLALWGYSKAAWMADADVAPDSSTLDAVKKRRSIRSYAKKMLML